MRLRDRVLLSVAKMSSPKKRKGTSRLAKKMHDDSGRGRQHPGVLRRRDAEATRSRSASHADRRRGVRQRGATAPNHNIRMAPRVLPPPRLTLHRRRVLLCSFASKSSFASILSLTSVPFSFEFLRSLVRPPPLTSTSDETCTYSASSHLLCSARWSSSASTNHSDSTFQRPSPRPRLAQTGSLPGFFSLSLRT